MSDLEIERKFLVDRKLLPKLGNVDKLLIKQGYLSLDPTTRIRLVKLNTEADYDLRAYLTVKGKGKLARKEIETEINYPTAVKLYKNFCTLKIRKTRYIILYSGHFWEVDYFKDLDLWMAEIELKSVDEKFSLPKWVTKEVTFTKGYSNVELAKKVKSQ